MEIIYRTGQRVDEAGRPHLERDRDIAEFLVGSWAQGFGVLDAMLARAIAPQTDA